MKLRALPYGQNANGRLKTDQESMLMPHVRFHKSGNTIVVVPQALFSKGIAVVSTDCDYRLQWDHKSRLYCFKSSLNILAMSHVRVEWWLVTCRSPR